MLKKIILPTVVISGTLFASFLLLLALQGSKPVKIQVEGQEIYYGELKDFVSPGVGAAFSLGLGLAGALMVGLQHSVRQSSELEKKVLNLEHLVTEKDSQIKALQLSPANPMFSKLSWFLDEENQTPTKAPSEATTVMYDRQSASPIAPETKEAVTAIQEKTQPLVITHSTYETQPITLNQLSVQTAISAFPSAQSALGLTRKGNKASVS
ncbi:hypothetical protein F7734_06800 [Scytonema sp. UIC 10036]|uniref:hypothetical protein n=1 Tax=Scytonema sp. UIC 10036 TaxID=2304196 RepID=UPI0012DAA0CE|nr:hypothetical protein [Scytonema sp. UIC 10036]MUG92181.1 hypothetical protein [Scytonema sp. UIC 10036]